MLETLEAFTMQCNSLEPISQGRLRQLVNHLFVVCTNPILISANAGLECRQSPARGLGESSLQADSRHFQVDPAHPTPRRE